MTSLSIFRPSIGLISCCVVYESAISDASELTYASQGQEMSNISRAESGRSPAGQHMSLIEARLRSLYYWSLVEGVASLRHVLP